MLYLLMHRLSIFMRFEEGFSKECSLFQRVTHVCEYCSDFGTWMVEIAACVVIPSIFLFRDLMKLAESMEKVKLLARLIRIKWEIFGRIYIYEWIGDEKSAERNYDVNCGKRESSILSHLWCKFLHLINSNMNRMCRGRLEMFNEFIVWIHKWKIIIHRSHQSQLFAWRFYWCESEFHSTRGWILPIFDL